MTNNDNIPRIPAPQIHFQGKQMMMRKSPATRLVIWVGSAAAIAIVAVTLITFGPSSEVTPNPIKYLLPAQPAATVEAPNTIVEKPAPVMQTKIIACASTPHPLRDTLPVVLPPPRHSLLGKISTEGLAANHLYQVDMPEILTIEPTQHLAVAQNIVEPRSNLVRIIVSMEKPQFTNTNINQLFAKK